MIDLTPVVQPALEIAGTVASAVIAIYAPKAIAAFQNRTGIMFNDQQRAVALGAVQTAAGIIETMIDQGALKIEHVNIGNAAVQAQANAVLSAIPEAGRAMGLTPDAVARMIVGKVDTLSRTPPASPVTNPGATP